MITNDSIWGNIRDRADNDVWDTVGHGAPANGTGGTGAGITGPGSTYTDITNIARYFNTGTKASPVWVNITTLQTPPSGGTVGNFNVGVYAASGNSQSSATPITANSPANIQVTGGNNANGCRLPVAKAGAYYAIVNSYDPAEQTTMFIYPSGGEQINKRGANNPVSIYSISGYVFICTKDGEWYSIPNIQ